jgi:hypothetical protein
VFRPPFKILGYGVRKQQCCFDKNEKVWRKKNSAVSSMSHPPYPTHLILLSTM